MLYISRDFGDNTYGVTDTDYSIETKYALKDIIFLIESTGVRVHGVSKRGKIVGIFNNLEALYNFELARLKLLGDNIDIKFDGKNIILRGILDKNVVSYKIPDFITKLGIDCFKDCRFLQDIVIPDSVMYLTEHNFDGCISLRGIRIPNSVVSIGSHCFRGCKSLESIELPNSVRVLGFGCFSECDSLRDIIISETLYNYCKLELCSYETKIKIKR